MSSYCLKCGENKKSIILQVSKAINSGTYYYQNVLYVVLKNHLILLKIQNMMDIKEPWLL